MLVIQTDYPQGGEGQFNHLFQFDEKSLQTPIPFVLVPRSLSNFELIWSLERAHSRGNCVLYEWWSPVVLLEMSGLSHNLFGVVTWWLSQISR